MVEACFLRTIHFRSSHSNNLRQTVSSSEEYRHQNSWKTGGLFHLKSRIALTTGNTPRTKPIKVMNTIGTQVLMANGISRRRFLVDRAGTAAVAGLSLAMKGTDTNQSGLAPAEFTNQGKDTKGKMSTITNKDRAQIYCKDWRAGKPIVFSRGCARTVMPGFNLSKTTLIASAISSRPATARQPMNKRSFI